MLTSRCCILYIIQHIYVQNILIKLHTLRFFFSSKCRLFHNATFFGSCVIHISYTGCAKIKKKSGAKGLNKGGKFVMRNFEVSHSRCRYPVSILQCNMF